MSYVTGISGNVISAASAAYAPTNSAEVSAIASAYATGGGSTISTGEFLGYTVVSADNGVSVVGNSGVVSSSVSVPYTDTTWATNTISANSNKSQFRIYNFNRTAGNMTSLPTGNSVRIRVTAATPGQSVYTDDQIHLIVYTGTNSGSPIGNWQVQSANGYKSAMWDKTVTWNSTNQPNMLITAENFNTYAFSTTALYSAVGAGSSASESSYTADVLAAHPSYVSSVASSYAESAVSSKADSSALSSYALSADVSGTVDLVSTQSANWGGSALALSAGPGVKLEKVGDTLVAGLDETVLWSGSLTALGSVTATEPFTNFEKIELHWHTASGPYPYIDTVRINDGAVLAFSHGAGVSNMWVHWVYCGTNGNVFSIIKGKAINFGAYNSTAASYTASTAFPDAFQLNRIVGIKRTASN